MWCVVRMRAEPFYIRSVLECVDCCRALFVRRISRSSRAANRQRCVPRLIVRVKHSFHRHVRRPILPTPPYRNVFTHRFATVPNTETDKTVRQTCSSQYSTPLSRAQRSIVIICLFICSYAYNYLDHTTKLHPAWLGPPLAA